MKGWMFANSKNSSSYQEYEWNEDYDQRGHTETTDTRTEEDAASFPHRAQGEEGSKSKSWKINQVMINIHLSVDFYSIIFLLLCFFFCHFLLFLASVCSKFILFSE